METAPTDIASPRLESIQTLRRSLYPELAEVANDWQDRLSHSDRFPPDLDAFLTTCAPREQVKPTSSRTTVSSSGPKNIAAPKLSVSVSLSEASPRW
jgi:hypothetical protein